MTALRFALIRVWRRKAAGLGVLALCAVLCVLLLGLADYAEAQRRAVSDVYDNYEIKCIITNPAGTNSRYIELNGFAYDAFLDPLYPLSVYCTGHKRVTGFKCVILEEGQGVGDANFSDSIDLVSLDSTESVDALASYSGVVIDYEEGYDASIFSSSEPVCVVPAGYEEGELSLALINTALAKKYEVPLTLRVVGRYYSENAQTIYMPFPAAELFMKAHGQVNCDSMSFVLADNRRLDEFLLELRLRFPAPNIAITTNQGLYNWAVDVQDAQFFAAIEAAEKNYETAEAIIPLLLGLSVGIGFFISMLCVRSGKQTHAVMRTLGTGKAQVFIAALTEQFILLLLGAGTGMAGYAAVMGGFARNGVSSVLLFLLCYTVGCCIAARKAACCKVIEVLNTVE